MSDNLQNLKVISASNFAWAKRWFRWFWGSQAVAFGVNALTAFNAFPPIWGALTGFGLATAAELLRWRSDVLRSKAETFKRREELVEGFEGFDFGSDVVNEFASKSSGAYKIKDQELLKGAEFASTAAKGPRRALENLHESAWFSHHLANRTAFLATVCLVVTLAVGTFALVFAIGMVKTHPPAAAPPPPAAASSSAVAATVTSGYSASEVVGTVVCGALTFLISINLFRYCLDLFQFSRAAADAVNKSEEMAAVREPDATKVQSLLFEYQIARQGTPMIPTVIWRWNHTRLDGLWPEASRKLRR